MICRHAKADYPPMTDDFDRPLKPRGEKDAKTQGELLAEHGFCPDLIVSSPAKRAIQTARIVAAEVGYDKEIWLEPSIYEENTGKMIEYIQQLPTEVETVMLFGHNPTLSQVAAFLLDMENPFELPTCGMICLENSFNDWKLARKWGARLRWMLIPRLKRKGEIE